MINSNKRKIGYLLLILGVILLVLIVLLFLNPEKNYLKDLFNRGDKKAQEEKSAEELFNEMKEAEKNNTVYVFDENLENNREWNESDFKRFATFFVERFGSYTNHSNFSNIEDLMLPQIMSSEMMIWADDYLRNLRANEQYSGEFFGVTTKVLVDPLVESFKAGDTSVSVMVSTQREEVSGLDNSRVYEQKIKVDLVKNQGKWLVDGALWQ
ncbi:MAG: hypothetical protein WC928_01540 [Patescibacteria group bacterium]|jgi:hypothetical protein